MEVAFFIYLACFTKKSKKPSKKNLVVCYHTCVRSSGDPCPPPPEVRLRISGMTSAAGLFLRVCACQGFRVKSAKNKMLVHHERLSLRVKMLYQTGLAFDWRA